MKPPEQASRVERMSTERLEEVADNPYLNIHAIHADVQELLAEATRARASELEWKAKAEELKADYDMTMIDWHNEQKALAAAEARAEELLAALLSACVRIADAEWGGTFNTGPFEVESLCAWCRGTKPEHKPDCGRGRSCPAGQPAPCSKPRRRGRPSERQGAA